MKMMIKGVAVACTRNLNKGTTSFAYFSGTPPAPPQTPTSKASTNNSSSNASRIPATGKDAWEKIGDDLNLRIKEQENALRRIHKELDILKIANSDYAVLEETWQGLPEQVKARYVDEVTKQPSMSVFAKKIPDMIMDYEQKAELIGKNLLELMNDDTGFRRMEKVTRLAIGSSALICLAVYLAKSSF